MTRIIGGAIGSRKLTSPAKSTRPTSDRIRESIFSSLQSKEALIGATVLDLYAGTGALALEALSRGAKEATLVESNKQAAAVCIKNARLVEDALAAEGMEVKVQVQIQPVAKFLEWASGKFDLVFIDSPYEIDNAEIEANLAGLRPMLKQESLILVERSSRSAQIALEGFQLIETKSFGDTNVYWLKIS
ncbi:MAG: 16S rRNA (guanine(966)-N(2))-methyltransferase RsmD [Actinomycetota bacterium]